MGSREDDVKGYKYKYKCIGQNNVNTKDEIHVALLMACSRRGGAD